MADVTTESGRTDREDWKRRRSADDRRPRPAADADADEERAQIILITGLTLAVLFVAVVLLLNTVIYTENLATRGTDAGGAEAVDFRDATVDDLAAIMDREHRNESGAGGVSDDFAASAETYAATVAELRARDGAVADVDVAVTETGYFVAQNETASGFRAMRSPGGAADWTVAANATRTRNFRLTVDPASLSGSDPFTIAADGTAVGTGGTWTLTLAAGTGDELDLTVENASGPPVSATFAPGPDGNHTVDVTAGTVNGVPFDALVWAEGVQTGTDPYDLRLENGGSAAGTYALVVDDRDGGASPGRPSRPYVADAVYSAEVEVTYRTPELTYGDVVRLAPGERDA